MLGAPSAQKTDAEGLQKIAGFQSLIEGHANATYSTFEPKFYTSQVVAGTNYQARISVGDGFVDVKVYEPLGGEAASVSEFKTGVADGDQFGF